MYAVPEGMMVILAVVKTKNIRIINPGMTQRTNSNTARVI
tara:strand:- start:182 stop:301 length:120 start_codon:yes stop_codon:yes gene_type:complete